MYKHEHFTKIYKQNKKNKDASIHVTVPCNAPSQDIPIQVLNILDEEYQVKHTKRTKET